MFFCKTYIRKIVDEIEPSAKFSNIFAKQNCTKICKVIAFLFEHLNFTFKYFYYNKI